MDEIIMLVGLQKKLPKIGETVELDREISGRKGFFKIKKIINLEWNKYNQLIITLGGYESWEQIKKD